MKWRGKSNRIVYVIYVENKKQTKNWSLWNSKINFHWVRQDSINWNVLHAIYDIQYSSYFIRPQLFEQDLMINSVKCFLEVNKNSTRKFIFVNCFFYTISKIYGDMGSRKILPKAKLFEINNFFLQIRI